MKLWPFKLVKHQGGHFEKTALEDFVSFCVILHICLTNSDLKLAQLPKFIHGNKLDMLAHVETSKF